MAPRDDKLAELLRHHPDATLVLSDQGVLLWANETTERVFGQSLEDSVGRSVLEYVHPDDLEIVLRSFESVQFKEVGALIEVRARARGEWRLFELIGLPVPWFDEGAILFSFRDISERRRFEVAHGDDARFRSLVHNAATIILLVSAEGFVESVSAALTRHLGHDPEWVENAPLVELVVKEDRPIFEEAFAMALKGSTASHPVVQTVRLLPRGEGEPVPYELALVNLLDDPSLRGVVVTAHDVSDRHHAESRLHATLSELNETFSLLNATLEAVDSGVLATDLERRITSYNGQFVRMWRVPSALLALGDDSRIVANTVEQLVDPTAFLARIEELYEQPEAESLDTLICRDGRTIVRSSKPQYVDGAVVGRVWNFTDVTAQKRLENELAHFAFHDTLTGLANRALFRDRLSQALARADRTNKIVAVMFLDLDNFKTVNDSLGHSAGDTLLQAVTRRLNQTLRRSDTAARLGGDEFAVLIEDVEDRAEVAALAERLLVELRRPVPIGQRQVSTTVSIGITFGEADTSSEQLLTNADLAMYLAKSEGKDRFEEYQAHMQVAMIERLELESDLRAAIDHGDFIVYYQPVFDLAQGTVVGFEALVRWPHRERGLLAPGSFVPFAEQAGLVEAIDRQVLALACSQVQEWKRQGLADEDLAIGVNLSPSGLVDPRIAEKVGRILTVTGLNPRDLILELTENEVMREIEEAERHLQDLKRLGLRIAIDDFGTGYSSFSRLERLPIDIVKIAQPFVAPLAEESSGGDVVHAIIQLARALGLQAVAEGVETAAQAQRLREMGCALAQGYYLGRPLDAAATEDLLRSQRPGEPDS